MAFSTVLNNIARLALIALLVNGCAHINTSVDQPIVAALETDPVPTGEDAADDAAIWIHPTDPGASRIVATDKDSGLLLYDLEGRQQQYLPLGLTNNVDLRQNAWAQAGRTLVVASQTKPEQIVLLSIDAKSMQMQLEARHDLDLAKPYGICLFQNANGEPSAIINSKGGEFVQYAISADYEIDEKRRWHTASKPEGCVADDETGQLYLGEEGKGIWQMSAHVDDPVDMRLFAVVRPGQLAPDVEGLALYNGERKLLIASSQGDSRYAVYDVRSTDHLVSFSIVGDERVDGVSETDGLDVTPVPLPGYPHGLLVVQDDRNEKPTANQNFKLISWKDVAALVARQQ
ncbi:MAG: phytase [Gammaproteobacteria bacterium]|nr:phytase [Gammaproteobacteria bacterium]